MDILIGSVCVSKSGSCTISITLKAANAPSDLSNWQDIWQNFRTLSSRCVDLGANDRFGGTMVTGTLGTPELLLLLLFDEKPTNIRIGENNRVRLEIYGPDSKLKKYEKLKELCKQGAEYQDLPQCNSDESVTEGISADLLAQLQQANVGAPLVQIECAANTYALNNGGACKGFVYDLITLSKDTLGVLFGVPSSIKWADTGAYVLSAAAGWIDEVST